MDCCPSEESYSSGGRKFDWVLWVSSTSVAVLSTIGILHHFRVSPPWLPQPLLHMGHSSAMLIQEMWWGVLFGILFIALLAKLSSEQLIGLFFSSKTGKQSLWRATLAGLFLDLCSHGILMVAAQLYRKGMKIGPMYAFLLSSPWNSFSLTLILISLIGLKFTVIFTLLSFVAAVLTGAMANWLVAIGKLPENPESIKLEELSKSGGVSELNLGTQFKSILRTVSQIKKNEIIPMLLNGAREAKMVVKWLFVGIVLASVFKTFISEENLLTYFGADWLGLLATLGMTTVLEVCSEGSVPLAADFVQRANLFGNAFLFLMAGVATDYTEVMILKETTGRWGLALALPMIATPIVFAMALAINSF